MRIERFDPADQAVVQRCHDIVSAGAMLDDPAVPMTSLKAFTAYYTNGFGGDPRRAWTATGPDGVVAGCCLLVLPDRDNTSLAHCDLQVAPEVRRTGIGSGLLAHCVREARAAGRTRLTGEAPEGSPGAAFAAAAGAAGGITEVYRVLTITDQVRDRLPGLRIEAAQRATAYSLISWTGPTPEEHLAGSMRLSGAMADAPMDDGVEAEQWDADRIRRWERAATEAGQQLYAVAARHDASGDLAAITLLRGDPDSAGWGFQAITAVLAEHRGHRLGLLVKIAMLDLLASQEAGIERIVTGNAGGNEHMIAINERLGFGVASVHRSWTLELT